MQERLKCIRNTAQCIYRELPKTVFAVVIWLSLVHNAHVYFENGLVKETLPFWLRIAGDALVYGIITAFSWMMFMVILLLVRDVLNLKNFTERFKRELVWSTEKYNDDL